MEENKEMKGAFIESLRRNNKQIKDDRAAAIVEVAQMKYKRKVEDLQMELNTMRRDQDNMLDLSPTNAQSLIVASDFKADDYIERDLALGVSMRNTEIKLEVASKRYQHLFGE